MKRHLNTLFVTTDGAYLSKSGESIVVRQEKEVKLRVPLHHLDGVVCLARVGLSPYLMAACAQAGVTISLLTPQGRFLAAVVGYSPGNVLLRRAQYRAADLPTESAAIAGAFVAAKLANCRAVLLRAVRDGVSPAAEPRLQAAAQRLALGAEAASQTSSLETLRGIEGEGATHYFDVFSELVVLPGEDFRFRGRSRRPPLDPLNGLLSFLYTLLAHDARSACEAAGLDAAVGFLHRDRPGRPGLALDLMEEFRPFLADRLALSLINRRQLAAADFHRTENGACLLGDSGRKTVLVAYQKRKQDEITHPFLGEKTTVGLLIHLQARLLARRLRGDIDAYPPFLWK